MILHSSGTKSRSELCLEHPPALMKVFNDMVLFCWAIVPTVLKALWSFGMLRTAHLVTWVMLPHIFQNHRSSYPRRWFFGSVWPCTIIFILCFSESLSRFATQRYRSTAGSLPQISMSTKKCFNRIFRNFATVCPLCLESRCGLTMRWAALRGTVRHCLVWLVEHQLTAVQRRCVPCCATERTCGCQCDRGRYVAVVFICTDVGQVVWEFSVTDGTQTWDC